MICGSSYRRRQAIKDAYDLWTKANEKARVYILASLFEVLAKKHEVLVTAREITESLQEMFGQPSYQLHHDSLKYIYTCSMKKGTSIQENVLDMMVQFNIA